MLKIKITNQFKKDLKLMQKRHCNLDLLKHVVDELAAGRELDKKFRNHQLTGSYRRIF